MRENEGRLAIAAFLVAVAIMAAVIGLFIVFFGSGDSDDDTSRGRQVSLPFSRPRPAPPRCADPDDCRAPSAELQSAFTDAKACEGTTGRVCLFLLGDVPHDLVVHLVEYYAREYALTVHVLPPVTLEANLDELSLKRPGQVNFQSMKDAYTVAYPRYSLDRNVLLIGLTAVDIYTSERPEWRWFFGGLESRHAVISIYRMDPVSWGDPPNQNLLFRRVRTLMNKYIAVGYYGLPLSDNPRSVTYRLIGGLDTLDGIDERIPVPAR